MTKRHFDSVLGCLITPAVEDLAAQLVFLPRLATRERGVVIDALRESLYEILHRKVSRLLVLELNAARVTGQLKGENSEKRWGEFLQLSSKRSFWDGLTAHYPTLLSRIGVIIRNRCSATLCFAKRWATDRPRLADLCGWYPGELKDLRFGAGDSHAGGFTVAVVTCEGGQLVYKPRSRAVDIVLRGFVTELEQDNGNELSFRVPKAVDYGEHGWAEFINHRYASGDHELRRFYHGIGHLLAIMRLLGGSDLHAENLIAQGGTPVIVDCETLFTPRIAARPSGYGKALDRAAELVRNTVLNIGLLPGRGASLGWRGVDFSGVGNLPGQQALQAPPGIIGVGSDEARVGTVPVEVPISENHPSPSPALGDHWPEVLRGFEELTTSLRRLDAAGMLRSRLRGFENCRIRVVPRATAVYAEIARMLWHPVSLHKPEVGRERAFDLLKRMADNVSAAPSDPGVINAEIDDLLEADIPCFSAVVRDGCFDGPRGVQWLKPRHLAEDALENWRTADFAMERNVIQASLLSAYINDGWIIRDRAPSLPKHHRGGDLEMRRQRQAALIMQWILANAIHGEDGTVAWVAPVLSETGWSVRPLQEDLYNGVSGVALVLGAYLREAAAGRAEPMDGLNALLTASLDTLHLIEAKRESLRREELKVRPPPPGGYLGLGSQILTYLMLADWRLDGGDGLQRACKLADEIPAAAALDDTHDLMSGTAGAITPLLLLARKTNDNRYVRMASDLGDLLQERAKHRNGQAYWTQSYWPEGVGGFAHGVTGIGWALTRLARATGNARYDRLAQGAFAFEDALFDAEEQNWLDLRRLEGVKTSSAWCHGAVGIGLAHLNLDPTLAHLSTRQTVRRAVSATWRREMGSNHCACHGDLGAWELLDRAIALAEAPKELNSTYLLDLVLTSLEREPSRAVGRITSFSPGLLPGMGGVAYQLLRAHPENDLPSILIPCGDEL